MPCGCWTEQLEELVKGHQSGNRVVGELQTRAVIALRPFIEHPANQ